MFLTKIIKSKSKKKQAKDVAQLIEIAKYVEKLNTANKCEISGCYLQGVSTEKLFGIDDLYFDKEGVKRNQLQKNKSCT
jgi:ribosomal protein L34E